MQYAIESAPIRMTCRRVSGLVALIGGIVMMALAVPALANTVLITGANSGLGLEFSKQYAERGWTVIATHRRDEVPHTLAELKGRFSNVRVETMDVTNRDQVFGLAERLRDQAIDVLINNAGIFCLCDWMDDDDTSQRFGSLEFDHFDVIMGVNVKGVAMVSEAFFQHVKASEQRKMITITSTLGGLTVPAGLDALWYGTSKAAANKFTASIAEVVREHDVIVVPLHPGSVRVERQAELDPEENPGLIETPYSVGHMIETIDGLTIEHSGRLWRYDGAELPW